MWVDLDSLLKLTRELYRLGHSLRDSLGMAQKRSVNLALSIGVGQIEAPVRFSSRSWVNTSRKLRVGSPRLLLLKDIFAELSTASSLGSAYDLFYEKSRRHGR